MFGRGRGETDPVGSHPKGATPEGVFDLAGNEAEWTSSLFKLYPYDATAFPAIPEEATGTLAFGVRRMRDRIPPSLQLSLSRKRLLAQA